LPGLATAGGHLPDLGGREVVVDLDTDEGEGYEVRR